MLKLQAFLWILATVTAEALCFDVSHAISESLSIFRESYITTINIIELPDSKFEKCVEGIVSSITASVDDFTFTLENSENLSEKLRRMQNLIVIESIVGFRQLQLNTNHNSFNNKAYYIVALINGTLEDVSEIFKAFWKLHISNVNLIQKNTDESIELITFYPKSTSSCDDISPVTINSFRRDIAKWSKTFTFPGKFSNFNRCPIKVTYFEFYGFEREIFEKLANRMNFTLVAKNYSDIGNVFSNGTATGSLGKLKNGEIDILVRYLMLDATRTKFFGILESVFEDSIAIVVPPTTELSPFVKLFYPFTMLTWFSLFFFLIGTCCLILVAKFSSKPSYNFVVGSNISQPFMSLVVVVTGSSQHALPKGAFARTILACFLLFFLVVRTMYVGKLLYMMKANVRSEEITTIDGFYENGFQFYMHNATANMFNGSKYLKP